jgi:hypothetical protein
MAEEYHARLRSQIKLALLSDCGCEKALANLELEGRMSGLTGAEIDAALAGKSFDARAAVAISYACALKAGKDHLIDQAKARALRFGFDDHELGGLARDAQAIIGQM